MKCVWVSEPVMCLCACAHVRLWALASVWDLFAAIRCTPVIRGFLRLSVRNESPVVRRRLREPIGSFVSPYV